MRYIVNEIELNLHVGFIIDNGRTTYLKVETLRVLNVLIDNSGSSVPKVTLLDVISASSDAEDSACKEALLLASIKELRDLLGADVITTVADIGYQWDAELIKRSGSNLSAPDLSTVNIIKRIIVTIIISSAIVWGFKSIKSYFPAEPDEAQQTSKVMTEMTRFTS